MSEPAGYVIRRRLPDGQCLYLIGGSALTGQARWFPEASDVALRFATREEAAAMRAAIAEAMRAAIALEIVPAPPALPPPAS